MFWRGKKKTLFSFFFLCNKNPPPPPKLTLFPFRLLYAVREAHHFQVIPPLSLPAHVTPLRSLLVGRLLLRSSCKVAPVHTMKAYGELEV